AGGEVDGGGGGIDHHPVRAIELARLGGTAQAGGALLARPRHAPDRPVPGRVAPDDVVLGVGDEDVVPAVDRDVLGPVEAGGPRGAARPPKNRPPGARPPPELPPRAAAAPRGRPPPPDLQGC